MNEHSRRRAAPSPEGWFALAFGLFLGLALVKFGNPVILESKIEAPKSVAEFWMYAWPPHWSLWLLLPLVPIGGWLVLRNLPRWPGGHWLWILPLVWFGWQLVSATRSVDGELTTITVWHFTGCLACYFLGAWLLGRPTALRWLLIGLLAAFAFCLVRAANQKLFEFPQEKQFMIENERTGWTNLPPALVADMKQQQIIISTNGVDVANPAILAKYDKGRVHGTLVYPNALAGVVLMLFPVSVVVAFAGTRRFRKLTRVTAICLTLFLGLAGLFWTGSKSGWLIGLLLCGVYLFRLRWPGRAKWIVLGCLVVGGLVVFGVRFHGYFAAGATSIGARMDYWRAACANALAHPMTGSGPGTFQRPYAQLKSPDAEMARLTHNDFLEQFSDSGFIGGLAYAGWIGCLLGVLGRRTWTSKDGLSFAIFLGLLGWFIQGLSEFELYIPALAWSGFALAGSLLNRTANAVDIPSSAR